MSGPEVCANCGGFHYRRDPCIVRKPVVTETYKRGPGRPKTITDMRAYKAEKQRQYRAEIKAGIRIPKRGE